MLTLDARIRAANPSAAAPAETGHRPDFPIPFGWFAVADSRDLAPGDVKPIFFFEEHLVVFRTADGAAHVTGAFCPHLGAHLGHGGTVDGNALVCPFHGWRFDGRGRCVGVPYASAIPARAAAGPCLRTYPVVECSGVIWAWYHPRGVAPLFDLDTVPELEDPAWCEPERYAWEVDTPIQEAGENAVDVAHFVSVHGAQDVPKARITLDGHRRETRLTVMAPAIDEDGNLDLTALAPVELVTTSCGPGMGTQVFGFGSHVVMLATSAPITSRRMKMTFAFTWPLDVSESAQMIARGLAAEIVRQVKQDIPIWENKTYHAHPMLCDGDGPVAKYRRWFGQFYDEGG